MLPLVQRFFFILLNTYDLCVFRQIYCRDSVTATSMYVTAKPRYDMTRTNSSPLYERNSVVNRAPHVQRTKRNCAILNLHTDYIGQHQHEAVAHHPNN